MRPMVKLQRDQRRHDVVSLAEAEEVRECPSHDRDIEPYGADDIHDVLLDAQSAGVLRKLS